MPTKQVRFTVLVIAVAAAAAMLLPSCRGKERSGGDMPDPYHVLQVRQFQDVALAIQFYADDYGALPNSLGAVTSYLSYPESAEIMRRLTYHPEPQGTDDAPLLSAEFQFRIEHKDWLLRVTRDREGRTLARWVSE